jgi:hypothetical protein
MKLLSGLYYGQCKNWYLGPAGKWFPAGPCWELSSSLTVSERTAIYTILESMWCKYVCHTKFRLCLVIYVLSVQTLLFDSIC